MKRTITLCIAALLTTGSASAQLVTSSDGPGNLYGNTGGFAIDFDATIAPNADWTPDLVAGLSYTLDSVSLNNGSGSTAGDFYLGVYSAYDDALNQFSGFLGASVNTVNFSTSPADTWLSFTFSGINVTADSTAGSGSGLLYFTYQTTTGDRTGLGVETANISLHRLNFDAGYTANLSAVMAGWGDMIANRSPEYQASLTVVPEPSSFALLGLAGLALARRRSVS